MPGTSSGLHFLGSARGRRLQDDLVTVSYTAGQSRREKAVLYLAPLLFDVLNCLDKRSGGPAESPKSSDALQSLSADSSNGSLR